MKPSGIGKIVVWQGGSLWIGQAGEATSVHSHHAVQFTIGLTDAVQFRDATTANWSSYRGALVGSHRPHAFCGEGALIAHIFVEPESSDGQILLGLLGSESIISIPDAVVQTVAGQLQRVYLEAGNEERLAEVATIAIGEVTKGRVADTIIDSRILQSLSEIDRRLGRTVSLHEVAASVHLSPGRFRHLFVEQTGMTFRAYVLWLRIKRAVERVAVGDSLTEAAHAAGFSDSAHLSRTFRRMFGVAPASLHQS